MDLKQDLKLISDVARQAGELAMTYFVGKTDNTVWRKAGDSPVSEADFAVDRYLRERLTAARPHYGWLSEETEDHPDRLERETVFVVDPIDGTRGFIAGVEQWCISVGIVSNGRPVAGILECPALNETYAAAAGLGAVKNGGLLPLLANENVKTVTASKKLNRELENRFAGHMEVLPFVPSLAYRIAMVASGHVDAAFARAGAHDWDLAAADIILHEAGGLMSDLGGRTRPYNSRKTSSGPLLASSLPAHEGLLKLAKSGGFLQ